jgi:hypothetical protein
MGLTAMIDGSSHDGWLKLPPPLRKQVALRLIRAGRAAGSFDTSKTRRSGNRGIGHGSHSSAREQLHGRRNEHETNQRGVDGSPAARPSSTILTLARPV